MASLQRVKVGRHPYDRIGESRRVNGQPRPIPVVHLGTADPLLQRLLTHAQPPFTLRSYPHGDVAAWKAMAERLGLVARIDRQLPASRRPLSMGTTRVLAAIKRAVWPCSKRAWASGAQRPSLHRLFAIHPEALTSQDCWDQRDAVSGVALEAIEAARTRPVVQDCQRNLATLFADTANFFTDLASDNARSA
ncbi:MAG: hypothetical protein ACREOH_15500 [Candidatus Entotheonellia bacterium]